MREIRIRQLPIHEARAILENQLNDAFMAGETVVSVLHGIGTGTLRKMTLEVASSYDFVKLSPLAELKPNPGVTILELMPPSRRELKRLRGKSY